DQKGNGTDDSGEDRAGIVSFEQKPVDTDQQQPIGNRRIRYHRQQLDTPVRLDVLNHQISGSKFHDIVVDVNLATIDLRQQVRDVTRYHINNALFERRARRETGRTAHRLLGPVRVPSA